MSIEDLTHSNLAHFSGSERLYVNPFFKAANYTEGVKFVSDNGAAWLVTDMLAVLLHHGTVKMEEFVSITIKKDSKGGAIVIYDDGNGTILYSQSYPVTDFPLDEVMFFFTNQVLMLASEY